MQPDREDERARIEACGGRVVYLDGARVEGILAMSRAIGNFLLLESTIFTVVLFLHNDLYNDLHMHDSCEI